MKIRSWFTLFFIPLIPYKTEYVVSCPICRNATVIAKDEFEAMVQGLPGKSGLEAQAGLYGDPSGTYNKYAGKTETQINYLKQMEEIQKEKESMK